MQRYDLSNAKVNLEIKNKILSKIITNLHYYDLINFLNKIL